MAGNPTRQRLDISYLRDPLEILGFDDRHGVGLLHDRAGSLALRGAETLVEYDHLVAAVDRESGVAVAYLGLHDLETADERLIVLGGGFVQDDPAGRMLVRRMLAALMLRVAGIDRVPTVLATCTSDPAWLDLLHEFGRRFDAAACYPAAEGAPVVLRTAALARRVARAVHPYLRFDVSTGVVQAGYGARWAASGAGREMGRVFAEPDQHLGLLDLRGWGEGGIVDTAVRIYRSR